MAPIIKNEDSAAKQTIRVLYPDGSKAGSTYPKRAAGLVKKGRACYVNDLTIRLNMSDAIQKSEVIKMDNVNKIEAGTQEQNEVVKLYFNARNWKFNKDCGHNVGTRSFMHGPDGELTEAYMIGDWGHNWTEIVSNTLILPKNTVCSFIFWLNGGENDHYDEVCRFEVVFDNDYDQRYTYNLNRSYIKPLKKMNGWELYEILFRTQNNDYTQLRFVAQRAYMTVMAAKDAAAYSQFKDSPDPFEAKRPQRHNLIFPDGFPSGNCWYSTEQMIKKYGAQPANIVDKMKALGTQFNEAVTTAVNDGLLEIDKAGKYSGASLEAIYKKLDEVTNKCDEVTNKCEDIANFDVEDMVGQLRNVLEDAFGNGGEDPDLDEILNDAAESIQDTLEGIQDTLGDIQDSIQDALEEVADQMEELKDSLLDE